MPEVISIGHDDDLADEDFANPIDRPKPPKIAPLLGIGAVVVVVALIAFMFFSGDDGAKQTTATTTTVAGPVATPLDANDARAEAVRAALTSWASFASTGDIASLNDTFDTSGPQYAGTPDGKGFTQQLANFKVRGQLVPPYKVTATNFGLLPERDQRQAVVADVVWSRPNEPDQKFRWTFELVGAKAGANGWKVWTVSDAPADPNAIPTDFCGAAKYLIDKAPKDSDVQKQINKTKDGKKQIQILTESTAGQLAVWKAIDAAAPTDAKSDTTAVVSGLQKQLDILKEATSVSSADQNLRNDTAVAGVPDAVKRVDAVTTQQCNVSVVG